MRQQVLMLLARGNAESFKQILDLTLSQVDIPVEVVDWDANSYCDGETVLMSTRDMRSPVEAAFTLFHEAKHWISPSASELACDLFALTVLMQKLHASKAELLDGIQNFYFSMPHGSRAAAYMPPNERKLALRSFVIEHF